LKHIVWLVVAGAIAPRALAGSPVEPPPPAPPGVDAASAAAEEAKLLSFYPPDALSHGIDGSATIRCQSSQRGALRNCTLVGERPTSHGFGAAALSLGLASGELNPLHVLTPEEAAQFRTITVSFVAAPARITPDLLNPAKEDMPSWARRPNGAEYASAFPYAAAVRGVSGKAVVRCGAGHDGRLTGCEVIEETPSGLGFGAAAMELTHFFRFSERSKPLDLPLPDGLKITIPILFPAPR